MNIGIYQNFSLVVAKQVSQCSQLLYHFEAMWPHPLKYVKSSKVSVTNELMQPSDVHVATMKHAGLALSCTNGNF